MRTSMILRSFHHLAGATPRGRRHAARPLALAVLLAGGLAGCGDTTDPTDVEIRPSPLAGLELHVPWPSSASQQADAWRETRPDDAAAMDRIAREPRAVWLTDGTAVATVEAVQGAARAAGTVAVFVLYNIPFRDCSPAGAADAAAYRGWVRGIAATVRRPAVVVLEPDALPMAECAPDPAERLDLLSFATTELVAAGALVYIDAGHPRWLGPETAASRLEDAGIDGATGFALNVSNFVRTEENVAYGLDLARRVGDVGFIIDTSRNGAGPHPDGEWCNPPGRKLGAPPTVAPPYEGVDALLWIKAPGESDGVCNGGPQAGEWWPEYALGLAS